ncbi:MAG: terpene cyclase/mutase family protein, partial [Planctomycetota bacterium]|nr:terpene cyclase/mutase family protein [Planctomycetota bacterium]
GDSSETHGFKPDALMLKIRHTQAGCKPFADPKDVCLETAHWQVELTELDIPAAKTKISFAERDKLGTEIGKRKGTKHTSPDGLSDRQVVIDVDPRAPWQSLETVVLATCRGMMWNLVLCCGEEAAPMPLPNDKGIFARTGNRERNFGPAFHFVLVRDEESGRTVTQAGGLLFDDPALLADAVAGACAQVKEKRVSLDSVRWEDKGKNTTAADRKVTWSGKVHTKSDCDPDVAFIDVMGLIKACASAGCQVPELAAHQQTDPQGSGVLWAKRPVPAGEITKTLPQDLSPMLVMVPVDDRGRPLPEIPGLDRFGGKEEIDDLFPAEEDPIIEELPDHVETPDDDSSLNDKEDLDLIGGEGVYDSMGIGSGKGERFGGRLGGRRVLDLKGGARGECAEAVVAGLTWLAKHQGPDGCWDSDGFSAACKDSKCSGPGHPGHDVGVTGLALLAFLSAGHTHLSRGVVGGVKCSDVVKNGILWLQRNQDASGRFCPETGVKHVLDHAIATLAMCEIYGMTKSPLMEKSAAKGIEYLIKARTQGRAWRYEFQSGDNDMCVTGWCVMALKSAHRAGIDVGQSNFEEALKFLGEVTDETTCLVGYKTRGDATTSVARAGINDKYKSHPTMTAMGMLVRMFIEIDAKSKTLATQAKALAADLPERGKDGLATDYHYWFLGTFALATYAEMDGKGGEARERWKLWSEIVKKAAIERQKKGDAGCGAGSWDADDRWGYEGGRVYATALGTLTLDLCRRFEK